MSAFAGCGGSDSPPEPTAADFTGTTAELVCGKTGGASTLRTELLSRDFPRERIPITGGEIVIEYSKPVARPQQVNGVEMYGRKTPLYVTNGKSVRVRIDDSARGSAALMFEPTADRTPTTADNLRFTACPSTPRDSAKALTGWPGAIFTQDAGSCVQLIVDDGETIRARTLKFGRSTCS